MYARSVANISSSLTAEGVRLIRPCDNATLTPVCPSPPPPPNPLPPPPPQNTQFVPDGGFETVCGTSMTYTYKPPSTTWAFEGASGVIGPRGSEAFYSVAAEGSCYGFLQNVGAVSINVTGLEPGGRYSVSWSMKGRFNNGDPNVGNGDNDINVYAGGAPLYSEVNVTSSNTCRGCWAVRTSPGFIAKASVVLLRFATCVAPRFGLQLPARAYQRAPLPPAGPTRSVETASPSWTTS